MQSLKLGLIGSEVTLPTKSRTNNQGTPQQIYQQSQSINGTLNTDFVGIKEQWGIGWEILTETDRQSIRDIIDLQYNNGVHLNFIYTDEQGTETEKLVFAEIASKGTLLQRDFFYTASYGISLKEC